MQRIPTYIAREKLPAAGPNVRGSMAQAGRAYEGMAELGEAVADLGKKIRQAREVDQYYTGRTAARRMFNEFEIEERKNEDYLKSADRFDRRSNEIYREATKRIDEPGAKKGFELWFADEMAKRKHVNDTAALLKEQKSFNTNVDNNLLEASREVDRFAVGDIVEAAVRTGMLSPEKAAAKRSKALRDCDVNELSALISQNPEGALEALDEKKRFPYLDGKEKLAMRNRARLEIIRRERIAEMERAGAERLEKEREDEAREAEADQIYGAIREGDLPTAARLVTKAEHLDEKTKLQIQNSLLKTKWETNPAVKALVTESVRGGLITKREQLLPYLGNGLSQTDYESALSLIGETGKFHGQLNYFKEALDYFDSQAGAYRGGKPKKALMELRPEFVNTLSYLMKQEDLTTNNPQVYELGKKLMEKIVVSRWKSWMPWPGAGEERIFETISERKPWITHEEIDTGQYFDLDILDASPEETDRVHRYLAGENPEKKQYKFTRKNKRLILKSIREGKD
jgi:hypothetical protein